MKHNVTMIAPVRHIVTGVEADSARVAAMAVTIAAEDEIRELHDGRATPAWMDIERTEAPEQPLTIEVRDETGAVTHWQTGPGGEIVPVKPTSAAAALNFLRDFIMLYNEAKIFAWEDATMKRMRERALTILEPAAPAV